MTAVNHRKGKHMTAPNVVVFLTDDQPMGLLDAMPVTRARIRDAGVRINYGMSPSPLCAMSRASLLTGRAAGHELGIWDNYGLDGGYQAFGKYENETIATALKGAGLRTGLFGKYMNGWNLYSGVVPPGWDEFCAINPDDGGDGEYYNYSLRGTVDPEHFDDQAWDYSTDVLRDKALDFIDTTPTDQPLFLYFSPYGVHNDFTAAPRHIGQWTDPITLNPAVNESNAGKPPWMSSLQTVSEDRLKKLIKDQHETIMSIDEAIEQIMDAMEATGRTDTLYVFGGDNGLQRGQHRLMGKYVPYQASTHLQMLLRWDTHIVANSQSDRITTLTDLTKTIMEATGGVLPNASGISFFTDRNGTFLEGTTIEGKQPAYIGWRTRDFLYVKWSEGYEELYEYANDPHELSNVAVAKTSKRDELRSKAQDACQPRPPGWV